MQSRLDGKLALLYTILILQVLIVMIYVATTPTSEPIATTTRGSVSFVNYETVESLPLQDNTLNARNIAKRRKPLPRPSPNYLTIDSFHPVGVSLPRTQSVLSFYSKQGNGSFCFKAGVDTSKMSPAGALPQVHQTSSSSSSSQEKCICKPGWHGPDCGQPEVVWRAIMASKATLRLRRRRTTRRVVYSFCLSDTTSGIVEVIVEELSDVVDLFLVCDRSGAEDNFQHRLDKGSLADFQRKILYVNVAQVALDNLGSLQRSILSNFHDDDLYVASSPEEIFNSRALMFLKLYDGLPQPVAFRLRWSVYGFYYQHPQKTTIATGAYTLGLLRSRPESKGFPFRRSDFLGTEEHPPEDDALGLVIGDLNHYGGWFCHLCQLPSNIVLILRNWYREVPSEDHFQDVQGLQSLHDGTQGLQDAIQDVQNLRGGTRDLQDGIQSLQSGIQNVQGLRNTQDGVRSFQDGTENLRNLQNGIQGIQTDQDGIEDVQDESRMRMMMLRLNSQKIQDLQKIQELQKSQKKKKKRRRKIDASFVEELIGSGLWIDEKTGLLRAYRSRDSYFAPEVVLNNTWKYDWLIENFYAKLDYY